MLYGLMVENPTLDCNRYVYIYVLQVKYHELYVIGGLGIFANKNSIQVQLVQTLSEFQIYISIFFNRRKSKTKIVTISLNVS